MPRGIPNKPKIDGHSFDESLSPDQWNERAERMDSYNDEHKLDQPIESSVPIGELAYKTEGLAPRSRAAFTRNADDRVNHFINMFSKQTAEKFVGKTHMPEECIPAGRKFMWARKSINGRPDDHNIGNLQSKKGWEIASADQYPGYAFYSDDGSVDDSAGALYMGGLLGVDRDERIHDAELKYMAKLRNATESEYSNLTSTNPNNPPRSFSNMESYNDKFFASTERSRSRNSNF